MIGWEPDAAARAAAVLGATVDGIDGPGSGGGGGDDHPAGGRRRSPDRTSPPPISASVQGPAFSAVRVRRAIAMGLDPGALAAAFGPGSIAATATAPCSVAGGCAGRAWWTFNAPAATAALAAAKFDLKAVYPLTIPDAPVPGLPDPAAAASGAITDQLKANLGLQVEPVVVPVATFAADLAAGASTASTWRASPPRSRMARASSSRSSGGRSPRPPPDARQGVADALEALARTTGAAERAAILATANDAIRATVPIVAARAPGIGRGLPVRRHGGHRLATRPGPPRLVRAGRSPPARLPRRRAAGRGTGAATRPRLDAFRLCGLVTEGLYGFAHGHPGPGASSRRPVHAQRGRDDLDVPAASRRHVPGRDAPRRRGRAGVVRRPVGRRRSAAEGGAARGPSPAGTPSSAARRRGASSRPEPPIAVAPAAQRPARQRAGRARGGQTAGRPAASSGRTRSPSRSSRA